MGPARVAWRSGQPIKGLARGEGCTVPTQSSLTLLRQDSLRQRTGRRLSREAGEVIRTGGYQLRVINVDDRRLAVSRVDRDLEEVEQVARPRTAPGAARADPPVVIRRTGHLGLREATAVDRLCEEQVPVGG